MTRPTSGEPRGWRDRAACLEVDPELFFPVGTDGPALEQTVRAKAVCARCPVRAVCLSFALVAIPEGVAGGLSAPERRALRDQRRQAAAVPTAASSEGAVGCGLVPSGVDGLVVTELVAGRPVAGASRDEQACAAVALHRAGRSVGWIAARLRVDDQQVRRWLARAWAGEPLNPGRSVTGAVA